MLDREIISSAIYHGMEVQYQMVCRCAQVIICILGKLDNKHATDGAAQCHVRGKATKRSSRIAYGACDAHLRAIQYVP